MLHDDDDDDDDDDKNIAAVLTEFFTGRDFPTLCFATGGTMKINLSEGNIPNIIFVFVFR
jgi:hypothetical protein